MKSSLQTKIMFFASGLLLAVLLCEILFNVFLMKKVYISEQANQIESLFDQIKLNYTDDRTDLYDLTNAVGEYKNIRITICDDEKLIYSTKNLRRTNDRSFGKNGNLQGVSKDSFTEDAQAVMTKSGDNSSGSLQLAGKFLYDGSTRYVLLVCHLDSVDSMTSLYSRISIWIGLLVLFIGGLSAVIFTRKILEPLNGIEYAAKSISKLEFDYLAPDNTSITEFNNLAKSINVMSNRLNHSIEELQLLNEQLLQDVDSQKRLEKMRREFIGNVSHEMKTPLCLLLMYSEGLKYNIESVDKDYYCDTIMEETVRLDKMVKSMLDISSIENGLSKIEPERIDFSEFVRESITKMSVVMEHLKVVTDIEDNVMVYGDRYYLEQAIGNYISNAASHTQNGNKIEIILKAENENAVFSVFNEGENIPNDKISHVWESFYQTDEARIRTEENHAGLGLYIVKTILNVHDGKYGVANRKDGVCFWFILKLET